jgi:hypothetical protein
MGKTTKRVRALSVLAMAVMAVMALGVGSALAQETYPPAQGFAVDCVAAGQAGLSVTCTVTGAQPNEQLTVSASVGGDTFFTQVLSANAQGEATFRFTVPQRYRGQQVTVTVVGAQSGSIATSVTTGTTPVRRGETVTPVLARTGQDALLLAGVGVVLLGAGLTALRRRSGASSRDDRTHAGI